MKFDCGETFKEYEERVGKWHDFFAILPRKVGYHDCRWLETIQRQRIYNVHGEWEDYFRAKEKK
jgi:hypothetical protein